MRRPDCFFLYSMLLTLHTHYITLPLVLIALLQFPIYGLAIVGAMRRKRTLFGSVTLCGVHGVCAALASRV